MKRQPFRGIRPDFAGFLSGTLGLFLFVSVHPVLAASDDFSDIPMPSVSVRGSVVTLTFSIPKKPKGQILHLSVDRGYLLGRQVRPGHPLVICVGHLGHGSHRLGFELAGSDQMVHTDEVEIPVDVPGGVPFSCPLALKGS